MTSLFRAEVDAMTGYIPGEQPKSDSKIIKLNSNENPYPPSPKVKDVLTKFRLGMVAKIPRCFCYRFSQCC